jgi:hypothetical protein
MEYIGDRISFVRKEDELSIVISAYSEKPKTNLLFAWFLAWILCGLIVLVYLFRIPDNHARTMILVWLGFWLYFSYKVWKAFTWRKFGKEIIKIGKGRLFYKRDNRGAGKVKVYETELIEKLGKYAGRQSDIVSNFMNSYWVVAGETLSFNYLGREILFGMEIDEKSMNTLLNLIRSEIK